jgi:dolichol-phosphate mannosyltransferase
MIVPTYNERDRLAELVEVVFGACAAAGVDLELVIVDDHSPDGTGALADELAATRRMKVVHRGGKLGLGTAVVAGFAVASAPVVGVMDADFSHPPALVPEMFRAFLEGRADALVASRYIPGGSTPEWPLSRRIMSRTACLLARPLSPIRDAASGFFLIRKDVARAVTIKAGGFKICLELLVRAWPVRLIELPYRFDDREEGESKMNQREALGYLAQLWDLYRLRFNGRKRPRREYQRVRAATTRSHAQGARAEGGATVPPGGAPAQLKKDDTASPRA